MRDLLQTAQPGPSHPLPIDALLLAEHALEVLTAVRDRRLPADTRLLACVRTGLLATVAALRDTGRHPDVAALLHLTWQSLTAHSHSTAIEPPLNQILLITRTHP